MKELKKLIECYEKRSELEEEINKLIGDYSTNISIGSVSVGYGVANFFLYDATGGEIWKYFGFLGVAIGLAALGKAEYKLYKQKKVRGERVKVNYQIKEIAEKLDGEKQTVR